MSWTAGTPATDYSGGTSATSSAVSLTGVASGSLKCVMVGWIGAGITVSTMRDAGSNDFTSAGTALSLGSNAFMQVFYLFGGSTGSVTYTATFSATVPFRTMYVQELTHNGSGSFDTAPTGGGSTGLGSTASSGAMTTTGTSEVVWAAYSTEGDSQTLSAWTINGQAADGHTEVNSYTSIQYRVFASTFAAGQAAFAFGGSTNWGCCAMAFKEASGASVSWMPGSAVSQGAKFGFVSTGMTP